MQIALPYVRLALTLVVFTALFAQFTGLKAAASGAVGKARKRLTLARISNGALVVSYAALGAIQRQSWDVFLAMIWLFNFYLCHQALKKLPPKRS